MWNARTLKIFEELGYLEQWRKNAIEEGKLEAARAMFAEGIKIEVISRVTEFPIKRLKKELKAQ